MDSYNFHRREFLTTSLGGIGGVALASMLAQDKVQAARNGIADISADPLAPKDPHFPAKAKRCIFIFMGGAPSQLDLFNYRPKLQELDGQKLPEEMMKDMRFAFLQKDTARILGSKRAFSQHGDSGMWFSDLMPNLATCADDICMINSMQSDQFNHHPGQLLMQCGTAEFGLPSMGSWLSYGLGTQNQNFPSYVVLTAGRGISGGSTLWSSGFLPSVYEGVLLRNQGDPILNLANPAGVPTHLQRRGLDALRELNQKRYEQIHDPEIASRISNYELAFRMQAEAPDICDISQENDATLDAYGVNRDEPEIKAHRGGGSGQYQSFATNCLLARRMVERGVRFVNLVHASWDHHSNLDKELPFNAAMCDQPIAALIKDLKQRGLLEDTLVVWGSEFGRTPLGENRPGFKEVTGRDHHPKAFNMWMAGGGTRAGHIHGATDELGWDVASDLVHANDLQATLLHLFGMDHMKLTYRHLGADKRLTSLTRESHIIRDLLA